MELQQNSVQFGLMTSGKALLKQALVQLRVFDYVASVALGAFDMDCGCMRRPARVVACSRGGVENGSVKLDIAASRGLLR